MWNVFWSEESYSVHTNKVSQSCASAVQWTCTVHRAPWNSHILISDEKSCTKWHTTVIRNAQQVRSIDIREFVMAISLDEAVKKGQIWPNITDCPKECNLLAVDFVAPAFKVQSFLNSWWSQCHNSVMDLKGGSCHQLEERFTASQTALKYAESSLTPAPLSLTPSPPCFFLTLTPYISGHALWGHFLCLSPVPVPMQVPPLQSMSACFHRESVGVRRQNHPVISAHKYSRVRQQHPNGILLFQLDLFKFISLTKGTKPVFFQQ